MQSLQTPPDLKGYVIRNSVLQILFCAVYSGSELIEFVRYYEPLFLRPHSSWETQDKLGIEMVNYWHDISTTIS